MKCFIQPKLFVSLVAFANLFAIGVSLSRAVLRADSAGGKRTVTVVRSINERGDTFAST